MRPSKYLFVPLKNGEWLRDSQGKPRIYKSSAMALSNLRHLDYDIMQIFTIDDEVTREEFEKGVTHDDRRSNKQFNNVPRINAF